MANIAQENEIATITDSGQSAAGFKTLISGCGIAKLSDRAQIKLGGKDRTRWLNGMITNNIRDLAAGHGVYAFVLNPQGQIQGDLYAYNAGEFLLIDTDRTQLENILKLFRRYIIMDKVEITEADNVMIQVMGPKTVEVLAKAEFQLPELQPLQFVGLRWNDFDCMIVRKDTPGIVSFEIWCSPEAGKLILQKLIDCGVESVNAGALELLRVACGIPRYGQDINEKNLPQETEQARALNFNKGCYIGQEIVERIRSRGNVHRKFSGFLINGPLPGLKTTIEIDGKNAGEITSVASLPRNGGQQNVALGNLRREFAESGRAIPIGVTQAVVTELPFADVLQQ
jgi:folate-binding protein YgfZ